MSDSMTTPTPERVQEEWLVVRHGGRRTDTWREVMRGSEAEARESFAKNRVALRQGEVRLISPDDAVVDRCWSPRLRTRW